MKVPLKPCYRLAVVYSAVSIAIIVGILLYRQKKLSNAIEERESATPLPLKSQSPYNKPSSNDVIGNTTTVTRNQVKNIYFYNPQFYHVFTDWIVDTWGTSKKFEACPVSDCIVTKGNIPMDQIDAIVFKPRDMSQCPKKKPQGQVWIFAEFETPHYFFQSKCFYELKNKVNWTMTYRRDADFSIAHGYFRKSNQPKYTQKDLNDMYAKKSKTAVVFISHCPTVGKRLKFIELLRSNGIEVDIFGSCGVEAKACNNKDHHVLSFNVSGRAEPDCFSTVLSPYKFFLSLENSLCIDYTTEKSLHRVMRHQILSVIRDGGNATMFHPPHSYIDTGDFKSVKELAQHMKMLDSNKTAYLEYFKWKQHYYTEDMNRDWNSAFCRLCERLHKPGDYRRVYRDIAAWHIAPGGKQACHSPTDLK